MRLMRLEGTATMAKPSTDELLDAFKEMTLIELSEFVKQFEETFGVTAAAPVAVAAAPGAGAGAPAEAAAEQDEFDVILEAAPKAILEKVDKAAAEKAKEALEGAGATVTVK